MKLIVILSFLYLALVSEKVLGGLIKAETTAWRWPTVTISCPPGTKMLSGGGLCQSMSGNGYVFLYESRPISDHQFIVKCDTPLQQNVRAEAYIVCA